MFRQNAFTWVMKRGAKSRRMSDANDAKTTPLIIKRSRELKLYLRRGVVPYSHSVASVLPSRHSSCIQFSVPSRIECRQVTPCRASSASGTKAGTTSKTFSNSGGGADDSLDQPKRLALDWSRFLGRKNKLPQATSRSRSHGAL